MEMEPQFDRERQELKARQLHQASRTSLWKSIKSYVLKMGGGALAGGSWQDERSSRCGSAACVGQVERVSLRMRESAARPAKRTYRLASGLQLECLMLAASTL